MAFTVRIENKSGKKLRPGSADAQRPLPAGRGADNDPSVEQMPFSTGNPRVERLSGVMHLYRPTELVEKAPGPEAGPSGRPETDKLCVLGVPSSLPVSDFCSFMGATVEHVSEMRILRDERTVGAGSSKSADDFSYTVLLTFNSPAVAEDFHKYYNGRQYSSLETAVCHVLYVKDVEYTCAPPVAPTGHTELPSCPVCLERLDTHVSGLVTTVCNHTFHSTCLSKWADSSCPVCRYCEEPPDRPECSGCGVANNLWICLICGFMGCGRYAAGHAVSHYQQTGHCYSMEVETQRVWDYLNDGYVHRLIASKTHGHLVELTSPGDRGPQRGASGGDDGSCGGGGGGGGPREGPSDDPGMEEALLASKLDNIALEYNQLLTSQLDSQRQYFENLLVTARAEAESAREAARAAEAGRTEAMQRASASAADAKESDRARRQLEKKLEDMTARATRAEKEAEVARSLNDALRSNQTALQERMRSAESTSAASSTSKDEKIKDLEEQLRDMYVYLETQRVVEQAGSGSELHSASVVAVGLPPEQVSLHSRLVAARDAAAGSRKSRR